MAYLSIKEIDDIGFKSLGNNVKISDKAIIYNPEDISIGNHCRIDDLCLLSGNITIGDFCHITPMCLLAGGKPGIYIGDFCTLAYGVKIFSQSDDYSGNSLVNSIIPKKYKSEIYEKVVISNQVVIGTNATIMPGVSIGNGVSVGASSLVLTDLIPWSIYVGSPARKIKDRSKKIIELEKDFLDNNND
ncbi:acyltransferase [Vibrio lentus]